MTDVTFSIPGSMGAALASVSAFGVVFSDVDLQSHDHAASSSAQATSRWEIPSRSPPPPATPRSPSSACASTDGTAITRVRITTGNAAPELADGSGMDVVMMDDFIYSEPVPEPGTLALVALGLAGLGALGSRRAAS